MSDCDNPANVYETTAARVGYVPRTQAPRSLYAELGFRCGLEVHQQLKTQHKLFCRCPAGRYQSRDSFDAQLVRHMRPTLSELGEYDGTALMEFKTRKNITYRICGETACTYDIDDTPPFSMNREALGIAAEIALLLGTQIVGEIHITRKQYLDGSIPTGFQRTALVGIHGQIPLTHKSVRVLQLSIEEDSCREVSDVGHERTYTTDRLGMPLVETVTYPDLLNPDEAAEAGHYIRFLTRSTGKVNVGIGATRQDVNVSIEGGTRVEIKGVQHIRWIPDLTHNEAFRQKALLQIRSELRSRVPDPQDWKLLSLPVDSDRLPFYPAYAVRQEAARAINLPQFAGLLSFFTNPGRCFADEISDRIKVVACIDKPNMAHSEEHGIHITPWDSLRDALGSGAQDAQLLVWGPEADMKTAVETIQERCRMAFDGVPNETRKALTDGTTVFERVLPGPDRMYPDTDSAPIPIDEALIEQIRQSLPQPVSACLSQMRDWRIPEDCFTFLLRRNLFPVLEQMVREEALPSTFAGVLLGHRLRHECGDGSDNAQRIVRLVREVRERGLTTDILLPLLPHALASPQSSLDDLLTCVGYSPASEWDVLAKIPVLTAQFSPKPRRNRRHARRDWIMGQLRPMAMGNVAMTELAQAVAEETADE